MTTGTARRTQQAKQSTPAKFRDMTLVAVTVTLLVLATVGLSPLP